MKRIVSIISTITLLIGAFGALAHEIMSLKKELTYQEAKDSGPSKEDFLLQKLIECESR